MFRHFLTIMYKLSGLVDISLFPVSVVLMCYELLERTDLVLFEEIFKFSFVPFEPFFDVSVHDFCSKHSLADVLHFEIVQFKLLAVHLLHLSQKFAYFFLSCGHQNIDGILFESCVELVLECLIYSFDIPKL